MLSVNVVKLFEMERFLRSVGVYVKPSLISSNECPHIVFISMYILEPIPLKETQIQVIPISMKGVSSFVLG